ncbi:DegV family protein [uncultured Allobaculum sp.]|uniref:DegV family protein n=1 Tax=uncultured Allobaculum sp. TaxID=1187017 RepID=UPI0025988399|nr:DegV family protein [uncultured Allobaculum sp.]
MMKLAFVTDSGTGFSSEYWKKHGIYSVPLQITEGQNTYDEFEDISYAQVIDNLHQQKLMKTSQPSLGKIEDLFEQLKKDGYEGVFCVPICRGLSGTLNAMESAAHQMDLAFYGFDCGTTAVTQSHCIITAKTMYEQGKSIEEIMEKLEQIAGNCDTFVLCDDLQHMRRGGRLTATAAALGGLLKIKPILHVNRKTEGRVDAVDKVRTMSRAQDRTISLLKDMGTNKDYDFTVAHVDSLESAKAFARKIKENFDGATVRVIDLVSAVGIHTGLNCLAVQVFDPAGYPVMVYTDEDTIRI